MSKILLVGKTGQLGWELLRTLACLGEVRAVGRPEIDLGDEEAVRALVRDVRPEIIVNAAAYTNVDGAESDEQAAHQANATAPGILAAELAQAGGGLFVHYSTDYVFNGNAGRPYTEDDAVEPLNAYGRTKLAGERAVIAAGCSHLILRTQWLYSSRGKNFLLTVLRLAREGKPLRIVADQFGAPTTARMLAEATALALTTTRAAAGTDLSGIYHVSAAGKASWYDFAKAIFEELCGMLEPPPDWCVRALASLQPITTPEYPTPAARPGYSVLSNERFSRIFGLAMPGWRQQLRLCLEELKGSAWFCPGKRE